MTTLTQSTARDLRPGDVFILHNRLCRVRWRQAPDREWPPNLAGYYTRIRYTDVENGANHEFSFGNNTRLQVVT